MKSFLSRLKKLENTFNVITKKAFSVCYRQEKESLIVCYINVGLNERFKWSGVSLWIPDNGRRISKGENQFILSEAYLKAQPEIADCLKRWAEKKGKELALNVSYGELIS